MVKIVKATPSLKVVWDYIKAHPGLTKQLLIDILIKDENNVSTYIMYFLRNKMVNMNCGKLFTVGPHYMTANAFKNWSNGKTPEIIQQPIPPKEVLGAGKLANEKPLVAKQSNILTEVKVEIKEKVEKIKNSSVDVDRYIRGYIGRDNKLKLIVMDKLPKQFPESTLWVVKVVFQKNTSSRGTEYWTVTDEVLNALKVKTGFDFIKFNGNYFTHS